MRLLISILILFTLFSFIREPINEPSLTNEEEESTYCNTRFNFCIFYPSAMLPREVISDNGDGIVMYTHDEAIQVTVYGSWSALNKSCEDLFNDFVGEKINEDPSAQMRYIIVDEDHYETSYTTADHLYYRKLFCRGNKYTEVFIEAPKDRLYSVNQIKEKIDLEF